MDRRLDERADRHEKCASPLEMRVAAGGARLVVKWPDGVETTIEAGALRRACRCADCTKRRAQGMEPEAQDGIAVIDLVPVGGYGVNVVFSDGHARGIFPWSMMRAAASPPPGAIVVAQQE